MQRNSVEIEKVADFVTDEIIMKMARVIANRENYTDVVDVKKEFEVKVSKFKLYTENEIEKVKNSKRIETEKIKKINALNMECANRIKQLTTERDNYINKVCKTEWSDIEKIRFLYLELANYLEKNTDFFLNDKLDKLALTDEEIKDIYENNILHISDKNKQKEIYQIICKSAAYFLKVGLDKLNIKNGYIKTVASNESNIQHWLLVAKDSDDNQYLLTLAADLPFIKNKFETEHFANALSFTTPNGDSIYCTDEIDKEFLNNDLDFVPHVLLNSNQLKEIDTVIGHYDLYESKEYAISPNFNKIYSDLLVDDSPVFRIFRNSFGFTSNLYNIYDNNSSEPLFDEMDNLSVKSYKKFKSRLEKYLLNVLKDRKLIDEDCDIDNFKSKAVEQLLAQAGVTNTGNSGDLAKLLKKNKKAIDLAKSNNINYYDLLNVIQHLLIVEKNFETYFVLKEKLDECRDLNVSSDALKALEDKINQVKEILRIKSLSTHLNKIAYYSSIRNKISSVDYSKFVPQEVIVEKFQLLFPRIFDCNFSGSYGRNVTVKSNSFSSQDYSEQIVIIKNFLNRMFDELTPANSGGEFETYYNHATPAENRINVYPIKNKVTGEYCIAFTFTPDPVEKNVCEYVYIPSENELKSRNFIVDRDNYWVVSTRYNKELAKIENEVSSRDDEAKTR